MPLDDSADRRQTYSSTFKILGTVETLKRTEKLVGILHVKPGAIVPHKDNFLLVNCSLADLDHGQIPWARVLHGISKQINKNLLHQSPVALDNR
jgi:hypothetical protein